jgi:hypothetical protein
MFPHPQKMLIEANDVMLTNVIDYSNASLV